MKDLTIINNQTPTIDSRDVADWVGKRHDHLCRDISGYIEHISNAPNLGVVDYFIPSTYKDAKGEERPCYLITRKGCEMVANKLTGRKGVIFTAKYIERFHEYENVVKLALPQDYPSALRALADSFERQQQLTAKVVEDAPKVLFASAVTASEDSISVGDLAKLLKQNGVKVGQKRLFQWLRDNGYLIKQKGESWNMPSQRSMEQGLFEIKMSTGVKPDGAIRTNMTPKVTGKGQVYFINMFLKGK